jgi:RNA polymerase sigma-70 factor (ECF subfamily)
VSKHSRQQPRSRTALAASSSSEVAEAGRRAVYAAAYTDHSGAVYGLARRVCGATHAEEITQNVFLRLWSHPDAFDPDRGSLRTFLLTMTHSAAVDLVRAETSHRARDHRAARRELNPTADIDSSLLEAEQGARITRALDKLPARERLAIVTAFDGRCSYKEAAVALNEAEGTIKSRIRAGLKQLRVDLADLLPAS